MKVYHILDHFIPFYSGYTFRSKYIMQYQKKWGIDVSAIISPKNSKNLKNYEIIEDIPCLRTHLPNCICYNIPYFREWYFLKFFSRKLFEIFRKAPCNIVHSHSPILCGIPALNAAKKLKIPVVYELRGLWEDAAVSSGTTKQGSLRYRLSKHYETILLKKVDHIITICEGLREDIIKRGISAEKIHVTPNGVNTDFFLPQDKDTSIIEKYKIQNKRIIGFIGSFYQYEGLEDMVQAMPYILRDCQDVILLLVGTGEREATLKNLVHKLNIDKYVFFVGQIPHTEIRSYYSVMDIVVYPRKKIRITELVTPLKPLEAMSMEKAVAGSTAGGIKELIQHEKTGLIFESGNKEDIASKCLYLLKNQNACQILGKQARKYVLEHRSWERLIQEHLSLYERLQWEKK